MLDDAIWALFNFTCTVMWFDKATTGGLDYEYSASGGKKYNELPTAKARRPADYLSISALNDGLAPEDVAPDIDEIIKSWR